MTPRILVFVATRVLALWCLVSSLSALASIPAMDWGGPGEFRSTQMVAMASLTVAPLLWGVVLWLASAWLARRVATDAVGVVGEPEPIVWGDSQLFAVGVSLLGLFVVVEVLPDLANWVAFATVARYAPRVDEPIDTTLQLQRWLYQQAGIARGASLVAKLGVGVVLLLGPRRVWQSVRRLAGHFSRPAMPNDEREE